MAHFVNPALDALAHQVEVTNGVVDSAVTLINGIHAAQEAAIAQALKNGATEAELAPLVDLNAAFKAKVDALSAAIEANSPKPIVVPVVPV